MNHSNHSFNKLPESGYLYHLFQHRPASVSLTIAPRRPVPAEAVTGALPGEQPGKAGAALPKGGATVSRQKPARAGVDKGISALLMSKVGYIKPGRW